jgi:predicted SAM-dependent methyltransferase
VTGDWIVFPHELEHLTPEEIMEKTKEIYEIFYFSVYRLIQICSYLDLKRIGDRMTRRSTAKIHPRK